MTDLECLLNYQGAASCKINSALRKRNPNDETLKLERKINRALNRLDKVPNDEIYRIEQAICSFEDLGSWFADRIGKTIGFPSFMSCSLNPDWMKDREFKFVIQTINNTNAHSLKILNPEHPESEVLFKSKSSFIIDRIDYQTKSVFLTESKEQANEMIFQDEGFFKKPKNDSAQKQSLSDLDLI